MARQIRQFRNVGLALVLILTLAACGGSSGGGGSSTESADTTSNRGTVGILLTDAPTDAFDAIEITITRIELFGDESGRVEVFASKEGETVDLLQLANVSRLMSLTDVPPDVYTKIRLTLRKLELIRYDDRRKRVERIAVKLPGNGKLDLQPRQTFMVEPGAMLLLEIDLDAKKSIHIVGKGNGGYQFRPVTFVNVISQQRRGKIVRLHGIVEEIEQEDDEQEFTLCQLRFRQRDEYLSDRCVEVSVLRDTSIFDSNADPTTFDAIEVGDAVTVFGRIRHEDDESRSRHHNKGGHDDDDDDDDNDDDDDDQHRGEPHDLHLIAFVVEIGPRGTFTNVRGVVETAPVETDSPSVTQVFDFTVDPAQAGIPAGTVLAVQLQEQTRIFSKAGEPLDVTDIQPGLFALVDGIVLLSNTMPDAIKSTFVVLDLLSERLEKVSGEILGDPDPDNRTFSVQTADDTEGCVVVPPETRIIQVVSSDGGLMSELVEFDALAAGQIVDVFGATGARNCLVANTIVIFVSEA